MRRLLLLAAAFAAAPALAQQPEELEQLEPDRGAWQIEYYGFGTRHAPDSHAFQLLYGLSDRVAVGVEAELESDRFDALAPTLLYRFSDAGEGLGVGLMVQAELDRHADYAGAEARLILERHDPRWWAQGNVMLRNVHEDRDSATGLAYSWGLSRALPAGFWIGLEGSGQPVRLAGAPEAFEEGGHFLGPALSLERDWRGGEIEVGVAWLRRIAGDGAPDSGRLFVQLTF